MDCQVEKPQAPEADVGPNPSTPLEDTTDKKLPSETTRKNRQGGDEVANRITNGRIQSPVTHIEDLEKDLNNLAINNPVNQPCEREEPRIVTAQSVIDKIEKLKRQTVLKSHSPFTGQSENNLTPHGPFDVHATTKRKAAEADDNSSKSRRRKEPSEQDERTGDPFTQKLKDVVSEVLSHLTPDPKEQEMLLDDIDCMDNENRNILDCYLANNFSVFPIIQPSEDTDQTEALMKDPSSPYSVVSYDSNPSPSSDYFSSHEGAYSDPSPSPGSPAFSELSDGSVTGTTDIPASVTDVADDYYRSIAQRPAPISSQPGANSAQVSQQFCVGTVGTSNGIPQNQSNQMQVLYVNPGGQQWLPRQQGLQHSSQSPAGYRVIAPCPAGNHSQTQYTPPAKDCGCGHARCMHRTIAPKPTPSTQHLKAPTPNYLTQPACTPSGTPLEEIYRRLNKDALVRGRRWVASIKKDDLTLTDSDEDMVLHIIVCQGDRPKLIALLERCSREGLIQEVINSKNIQTQSLLFLAILVADVTVSRDMVAVLLNYGANPLVSTTLTRRDSLDQQFGFPVHIVADRGNSGVPIMRELLSVKREEQLRIGCYSRQTALHYAALASEKTNIEKMVHFLLEQGADINAKEGRRGRTPLHYLVQMQDVEVIQSVLQLLGPDKARQAVNELTYDRCTALHIAAGLHMDIEKHQSLLRLLILYGAEVGAKNAQNQRAVDLLPTGSRQLHSHLRNNQSRGMPSSYTPIQ